MKKFFIFLLLLTLSTHASAYLDEWEILPYLPGDCLYDADTDRYADESGTIYDSLSEYMEGMGYTHDPDSGIWEDSEGFYYEDSWTYMSWEEAAQVAEEAGVSICSDCENEICDGEGHAEGCPEAQEEEQIEEEEPSITGLLVLSIAFLWLIGALSSAHR